MRPGPAVAAESGAMRYCYPVYWIKSPAWDLVWVLNALWLSPLVLLLARSHDDVRATRRARP